MARRRLGQHFLAKGSTLDRIARAACAGGEPLIIEIGPGKGALTERLLAYSPRVVAIEVDPELVEYLRHRFSDEPRLEIVPGDAMETDLEQWGPAALAGNLPYYAATPIVEKSLATFRHAVFLVQKEVAERLTAQPGRREYGFLTVKTWLHADARILFEVKPAAFRPPPKVDSAVVEFQPRRRAAEAGVADVQGFLRFASQCFRHKRKTIRNNLAASYGRAVEDWPEAGLRAEQISPLQLAAMFGRTVG